MSIDYDRNKSFYVYMIVRKTKIYVEAGCGVLIANEHLLPFYIFPTFHIYFHQNSTLEFSGGKWEITITTSDITNADTHAAVFVTAYGDKGKSDLLPLGAYGANDNFECGKESKFNVSFGLNSNFIE